MKYNIEQYRKRHGLTYLLAPIFMMMIIVLINLLNYKLLLPENVWIHFIWTPAIFGLITAVALILSDMCYEVFIGGD